AESTLRWGGGELATLTCLPAQTGFFQWIGKAECQYLNGTERVRLLVRYIHNRQQFVHFDSDVGFYVADTPLGEPDAKYWNSQPDLLEQRRAEVDTYCRHNYGVSTPFIVERRGECLAEHFPWSSK
ncbi:class II histocompatibility antigen beta chain family protein, partial [[Flexibacter] sp. ATCC 35208]|uniref:class II histocompatibility antigen beta chain family protein n=1 Tax=[Flexibacter] sp. ATCC 35208 TaxID=1936242 RepID=UPI0009D2086D